MIKLIKRFRYWALFVAVLLAFPLAERVIAQFTSTPNLSLQLPTIGSTTNWGTYLNADLTTLDTLLGCFGISTATCTVPGTMNFTGKVLGTVAAKPAASDAVQYVSLVGNDLSDGLSPGSAKATEAAACAALPNGNSSCTAGSGTIYFLGGTFPLGSTSVNLGSNIRIQCAGIGITVLRWTSNVNGIVVPAGTTNSGASDCSLSFSSAASSTSTGIRINASDASPTTHNIFRNLLISFDSLGTGTAGIYASGSGPSNTDVNANRFDGIFVTLANQAVLCTNCENNYWNVRGENLGGATNVVLFQENGLNADEVGTIRMEAGSSNFTGEVCYSTTGNNNIINLTCDQNKTGTTAINDTGGQNIFTVTTIGNPTLGTIPSTSQYRYADSTNGDNVFSVATLKLPSSGGGAITHQAPNTASNFTQTDTPLAGSTVVNITGSVSIASGFGTTPSIVNQGAGSGPTSIEVNVGTGGVATSGVLTLPAAPVGWGCQTIDMSTNIVTRETAFTTTSVTLTAASAWTASDKLLLTCWPF